jgi:hypothetical protein
MRPRPAASVTFAVLVALTLVLSFATVAATAGNNGKPGGGRGKTCTRNAPDVAVQNNWQWGASGSWGLPGQQIAYQILIHNNDSGCGSSTFTLGATAPSGFSVSIPTTAVSLGSSSYAYLWVYVTSPSSAVAGDYTLTLTAQRTNGPSGSAATVYKVYTSDTSPPTLFWPNPGDGTTISGRSYNVTVSSSDDHAVKKIDLYLDNTYVTTTTCDDITYICQLNYSWSPRTGQHSAMFKSYDWTGKVGTLTTSFTVS